MSVLDKYVTRQREIENEKILAEEKLSNDKKEFKRAFRKLLKNDKKLVESITHEILNKGYSKKYFYIFVEDKSMWIFLIKQINCGFIDVNDSKIDSNPGGRFNYIPHAKLVYDDNSNIGGITFPKNHPLCGLILSPCEMMHYFRGPRSSRSVRLLVTFANYKDICSKIESK